MSHQGAIHTQSVSELVAREAGLSVQKGRFASQTLRDVQAELAKRPQHEVEAARALLKQREPAKV